MEAIKDIIDTVHATFPFSVCLMNPPYTDASQFMDMQFVNKVNQMTDMQVVVHPGTRFISKTKMGIDNSEGGHLKSFDVFDANKTFNINAGFHYGGIYVYDNTKKYDTIHVVNAMTSTENDIPISQRNYYWHHEVLFTREFSAIVDRKEHLRKQLTDEYRTMVNDGHGFIYEENHLQRGKNKYGVTKKNNVGLDRVKRYLKEGTYKYCLYKGSFNNSYNEVQEWLGQDPDKLFRGQICWLTNSRTVRDNIRYWLECPLCDMWRKYILSAASSGGGSKGCNYGVIPAFDFEMDTDKFRKEVDKLNDFTPDEIREMQKYNIHNIDKYDTK